MKANRYAANSKTIGITKFVIEVDNFLNLQPYF